MSNKASSKVRESKEIVELLISFSKHLMIVLVACMAFAVTKSMDSTLIFVKLIYGLGLSSGVISFYFGYEANIRYINGLKNVQDNGDFFPIEDRLKPALINNVQWWVQKQFYLTIISLGLLCISLMFSIFLAGSPKKISIDVNRVSSSVEELIDKKIDNVFKRNSQKEKAGTLSPTVIGKDRNISNAQNCKKCHYIDLVNKMLQL